MSGVSFANQNNTFANAINEQATRTESNTPAQTTPKADNRQASEGRATATRPDKPIQPPQKSATLQTNDKEKTKDKGKTQTEDTQEPDQNIPANPHDPANGTLLEGITPNDSELSRANTELLATNAELVRQVDDLTTQVNVLVQERSGQLFVYGAMTAIISIVIGFVLAKLLTRQRW